MHERIRLQDYLFACVKIWHSFYLRSGSLTFHMVEGQLTSMFIKADDMDKQNVDKECIAYKFENLTSLEDDMLIRAIEKKKKF